MPIRTADDLDTYRIIHLSTANFVVELAKKLTSKVERNLPVLREQEPPLYTSNSLLNDSKERSA